MQMITALPPERTVEPVPRDEYDTALTRAITLVTALVDLPPAAGPEIENETDRLQSQLDALRKTSLGAPTYLANDMLAAAKAARNEATRQETQNRRELSEARSALAQLGMVRPSADVNEALEDREIRDIVRAMKGPDRAAFTEELRAGSAPRVALALARSPIPGDLEREAATIYAATSEPSKRANAQTRIEFAEWRIKAAQQLAEAADATHDVIALFIRAMLAKHEDENAPRAAAITYPDAPPPGAAASQPPNQDNRVTVVQNGSCITRL